MEAHEPNSEPSEGERAYKFAFEEGVRALSQQEGVINSYRTRAGVLLSAAAVATSFFGGQALDGSGLGTFSWIAIALFASLGVALLGIMRPGRIRNVLSPGGGWEGHAAFVARPSVLIEGYIEANPKVPLALIYRNVSLHAEERWEEIERRFVRPLDLRFRLASTLLIAEVAAWVIEL
ncbi:MAG: hypothetical protein AABM66_07125 [Actinomycetota bacterium]